MPSRVRREPLQPPEAGSAPVPMAERDLEAFYRAVFLPLVRRSTWKYGLTKEDARDIVQDAFVVAISRMDSTRNPKAWLIQVVDHLSLNHQRKLFRRAQLVARWSPGFEDAEPTDQGICEEVDR